MQDYTKLDVFRKADELTLLVYRVTKNFPSEERFGMAAHLRKTAEGCGRQSQRELHNFLNIAQGSNTELEYQLSLAYRLNYISESEYPEMKDLVKRVSRMLTALMQSIRGDKSLDPS